MNLRLLLAVVPWLWQFRAVSSAPLNDMDRRLQEGFDASTTSHLQKYHINDGPSLSFAGVISVTVTETVTPSVEVSSITVYPTASRAEASAIAASLESLFAPASTPTGQGATGPTTLQLSTTPTSSLAASTPNPAVVPCTVTGHIICSPDATQFGICAYGIAVMRPVSDGEMCMDGQVFKRMA